MGTCEECPGSETLRESLDNAFENQMIDQVVYKIWTTTDRSSLETKVQSVEEFLDTFMDMLEKLIRHDFIAKSQARYLADKRSSLANGEFLVVADFSENYSFIVQDAAQSFHWNNLQAIIHPFLVYF